MKVTKATRDARKKKTAEIFTPQPLVEEIFTKLPLDSWDEDKTFVDPAAGNGNFLVEVYKWKVEKYNHPPIKALKTIYGVELMADNVAECKMRLYKMAKEYIERNSRLTDRRKEVIQRILQKNIVCHNALTYNFEFKDLNFIARNKGRLSSLKNISNKWFTIEEVIVRIKSGTAVRISDGASIDIIKEDGKEYLSANISYLPEEI